MSFIWLPQGEIYAIAFPSLDNFSSSFLLSIIKRFVVKVSVSFDGIVWTLKSNAKIFDMRF